MRYPCRIIAVLLSLPGALRAQCPLTVDAGPDKLVCTAGGATTLDGSVAGPYIDFRWTPATGLSSATVLNPTATVSSTATYTLTAAALDPSAPNLVNNPGFESGNTGFTSGYTYNPTPITPGTYVLTTSPALVLSTFPPCDDHTFGNGTGNMMLINGNGGASTQAWCQTIPVMANSWYYLSAWVMNSPIAPPVLQFRVNGTLVGTPFNPPSSGCVWQEFTATWFSGAATSATVCIMDLNGSGNGFFGDDYALDDIFMAKACTVSDQVTVSVATVQAVAPPSAILGCKFLQTGITLNGSASTAGPGVTYMWDGPGVVSGGNTPVATVNEPGVYTLTVSLDTGNGVCTAQASVTVLPDPLQVTAAAGVFDDITCIHPTVQLDGSGSSTGAAIGYNWQPAANLVSGNGTLTPTVNAPGEYTLLVTNNTSGCTGTATVSVNQNTLPPLAAASTPGPLSCSAGAVTLSGAGSSTGGNFFYQWAGPGIVSGANTLNNCVVNAPGLYMLTVTNDDNGCTAKATVALTQSGVPPVAAANAPGVLNCITPVLTLNSAGSSSGPNMTYLWSTTNGHFTGPVNGPTATVDTTGVYVLTVTNTQNGCTATATATVTADLTLPAISIQQPAPAITCAADSVQLNAAASSGGPGFQVVWTASGGGNILSGDTTLQPWVDSAGTYTLTITNTFNGCTASATATVATDTLPPLALAAANAPGALNCVTDTLLLNGAGSSTDSTLHFLWTTPNGHIAGPDTAVTAAVDAAGWYILTVTNPLNGCAAADTVAVDTQFTAPVAAILLPVPAISCGVDSVQINATQSSGGPGFSLQWMGPAGGILSGAATLTPWAGVAGAYQLTVTDTANGCTASASVVVVLDTVAPLVQIVPPAVLDCSTDTVTLDATGSSVGVALSWSFTPGAGVTGPGFVSGQNTLMPLVNAPGTYTLSLLDTLNHCATAASVGVGQDTVPPLADAGAPPVPGCADTSATLDGSGSSQGAGFTYLWTGGATTLQPQVSAPGTYVLTVMNSGNHCTAVDSVTVAPFGNPPAVVIDPPPVLTCAAQQVQLNALTATGPSLSYQWFYSGLGSGIVSGDTTLMPTVAAAGLYTLVVTNTLTGCAAVDSVAVQQAADLPVANAGPAQILLCGDLQVLLDGGLSSAGPDDVYTWTTPDGNIVSGESTLTPAVNAAGVYVLLVTDTLTGCTASDTVAVQQDANAPVANAGPVQTITCLSATAVLDGSGSGSGPSLTYLWTTTDGVLLSGETTLTPLAGAAGTYTLVVTDGSNNCQSVASVQVLEQTQTPQAVAAAPQTLSCVLQQMALSGAGSSAGPGFSYQWSGPGVLSGGTTLSPQVNVAGNYTLTVTDQTNGCTATATVIAVANTTAPQAVAAAPQTLSCVLQQMALSGTGSSAGPNFIYQWSGPGVLSGGTTLSPQINAAGNYTLTVTDQTNGCTATATVIAVANTTAPQAVAAAPQTLSCVLQQMALSGAGSSAGPNFSYQWSGPGVLSGGTTLSPQVNAAGNYTLTVTDQTNGCTATAQTIVSQSLTTPDANAGSDITLTCHLPVAVLLGSSATPGALYQWTTADGHIVSDPNSLNPVVDAPGTYTFVVTDPINGCTATDTVFVEEGDAIFPSASMLPPDCATATGGIAFSGGDAGPYRYSIDGGANFSPDSIFTQLQPGSYETVVQDTAGCELHSSVDIPAITAPSVDAGPEIVLQAGASAQIQLMLNIPATDVATVTWSPADGLDCADCLNPVAAPGADITYTVVVTDKNGCTASATVTVRVQVQDNVYVPNAFSPDGDGVNDLFRVYTNIAVTHFTMRIYDRWGGLLFSTDDPQRGWDGAARGKPLNPGVYAYYVRIEFMNAKGETEQRLLSGGVLLAR